MCVYYQTTGGDHCLDGAVAFLARKKIDFLWPIHPLLDCRKLRWMSFFVLK